MATTYQPSSARAAEAWTPAFAGATTKEAVSGILAQPLMVRHARVVPFSFALGVGALVNCAPQPTVAPSQSQIPAVTAGTAQVWFLRTWDAPGGQTYVYGAAPVVVANGTPVGDLRTGTSFYRDFAPGNLHI